MFICPKVSLELNCLEALSLHWRQDKRAITVQTKKSSKAARPR